MIIELLLSPIYVLLSGFLGILPNAIDLPNWIDSALSVLVKGLCFFPNNTFSIIIINILFWLNLHLLWAVIEWVYHKIPGIT